MIHDESSIACCAVKKVCPSTTIFNLCRWNLGLVRTLVTTHTIGLYNILIVPSLIPFLKEREPIVLTTEQAVGVTLLLQILVIRLNQPSTPFSFFSLCNQHIRNTDSFKDIMSFPSKVLFLIKHLIPDDYHRFWIQSSGYIWSNPNIVSLLFMIFPLIYHLSKDKLYGIIVRQCFSQSSGSSSKCCHGELKKWFDILVKGTKVNVNIVLGLFSILGLLVILSNDNLPKIIDDYVLRNEFILFPPTTLILLTLVACESYDICYAKIVLIALNKLVQSTGNLLRSYLGSNYFWLAIFNLFGYPMDDAFEHILSWIVAFISAQETFFYTNENKIIDQFKDDDSRDLSNYAAFSPISDDSCKESFNHHISIGSSSFGKNSVLNSASSAMISEDERSDIDMPVVEWRGNRQTPCTAWMNSLGHAFNWLGSWFQTNDSKEDELCVSEESLISFV